MKVLYETGAAFILTARLACALSGPETSLQMLNITVHHDTDLSREEIVAVVSLIYGFWPSKEKSIPELAETFPEISRQYRASYHRSDFLRCAMLSGTKIRLWHMV